MSMDKKSWYCKDNGYTQINLSIQSKPNKPIGIHIKIKLKERNIQS